MSMLDVAISNWNAEVEKQEIELIEGGMPPDRAKKEAERLITTDRMRREAYKSGG